MNEKELVNALRYLIIKYVSKENNKDILKYLERNQIPVKGILADIDKFKIKEIESKDGNLIKEIYFYYC